MKRTIALISVLLFPLPLIARAGSAGPATGIAVCDRQLDVPEPPGTLDDSTPLRRAIVRRALGEVGTVNETAGPDGFKVGWRRLLEYHELALDKLMRGSALDAIKHPNTGLDKDPTKYREWCGIFAIWAVKKAAEDYEAEKGDLVSGGAPPDAGFDDYRGYLHYVWWNTAKPGVGGGPEGLPFITGTHGVLPGDIVALRNAQSHHAVVERVVGDTIYTINGNGYCQMISRSSVTRPQVAGYYRVE